MSRPLLTLLGGVVLTLLAVAAFTPGTVIATEGFALVVLTVVAGAVVMAVVARRRALRERAEELEDGRAFHGERAATDTGAEHGTTTTDRETDRG